MSRKELLVAQGREERRALQSLCEAVNVPSRWLPEAGVRRFKDWVAAWRKAPSLKAMVDDLTLGLALDNYIHADYMPSTTSRRAELKIRAGRPWQKNGRPRPDEVTLALFAQLITNPQCEMFGGPCRKCGKYFVKRVHRQTHCRRNCNSALSSRKATKARNKKIHDQLMIFVRTAKHEYERLSRRPDMVWQVWVAEKATALMRKHALTRLLPALKRNFVTRNIEAPKEAHQVLYKKRKLNSDRFRLHECHVRIPSTWKT
jgi:hypothetical protein